jgi:hypothetical protein
VSDGPDLGLESAAAQARRLIHDNDVEHLKQLLTEHPALLSWRADDDLSRVKQWFDESGAPALADVNRHYPSSPYMPKGRVEEYAQQWGPHSVQRVLDTAFAWSIINSHLEVADFLLAHGADINTTWSSHEPASILHELVFHANYKSMQFLIDRGVDMTILDYRWNATAQGWARYAANDEKMAQWLEDAQRRRERGSR